mmetsp:Transcript_102399/g.187832  ORF Transcript_102399/g.187832 Transcript_102399/m.187832 type:complete len:241 (-) Transcript_102399:2-724(-)
MPMYLLSVVMLLGINTSIRSADRDVGESMDSMQWSVAINDGSRMAKVTSHAHGFDKNESGLQEETKADLNTKGVGCDNWWISCNQSNINNGNETKISVTRASHSGVTIDRNLCFYVRVGKKNIGWFLHLYDNSERGFFFTKTKTCNDKGVQKEINQEVQRRMGENQIERPHQRIYRGKKRNWLEGNCAEFSDEEYDAACALIPIHQDFPPQHRAEIRECFKGLWCPAYKFTNVQIKLQTR